MAKGRVVDDTVRLLIANLHREHPDWRAKEVKAEINKRLGQDWPGLSVVQKELSKIKLIADNPQEKPWSTATLDSYPIPTEALPAVLKVWKSRIEKGQGFTIREAKWTARLSALEQDTERLFFLASRHARTELIFELIGRPFDSTELDRSLMGLPVGVSNLKSFLWLLAETREDMERGIKDGVEQIKAIKKGGTQ